MLNEAGFVFGFDGHISFGEGLVYITADNTASYKNILLSIDVHTRCVRTKRIVDGHQWRQFFPENWEVTEIESLNHVSVAYDGSYRLPSKTGLRFGEYWLIGEPRNHAVTIFARNILCR